MEFLRIRISRFLCRFALVLALPLAAAVGNAQMTAPGSSSSTMVPLSTPEKTPIQISSDAMVFQSAVDPNEYHMGPGDVLQLELWTLNSAQNIAVSPDQMLVVPRVGEFQVKGKTLAQIREEVYAKADQVFRDRAKTIEKPVTLSLVQPRRIIVKVTGDVLQPGNYTLTSATRANIAIDLANKPMLDQTRDVDPGELRQLHNEQEQLKTLIPAMGAREANPASIRYATVIHADGTHERIDALRYNSMHDPLSSPLLREDDVIYVPFRDPQNGSIGVYGAVQSPGDFEFIPGDSLSSAVKYALGPTMNADLHHVELTRMEPGSNSAQTKEYDLASILSHQSPDVPLVRSDRIIVRGERQTQKAAVVYIRGEVNSPGVYPIEDGVTKLSELVHEAGGFTPNAFYPAGSILRRGYNQRFLAGSPEEIRMTTRLANLDVGDTANFEKQLRLRTPTVVVYMDRLFGHGDSSADIRLQDGDEVIIPERPTSVYVSGFVNNAGYVGFVPGADARHYIEAAGGYADGAVKSKTRVIKVKTKAWMRPGDTEIEPGDEIFTPKETDLPEKYNVEMLAAISGIIVGLAGLSIAIYDRTKKQ